MAEKVTFKISAAAAACVRGDAPKQEKLKAARGEVRFRAEDLGAVLFLLTLDADPEIKSAALKSLRDMPEELLLVIAGSPQTHPRTLDLLARLHCDKPAVAGKLLCHPAVDERTLEFMALKGHLPNAVEAAPSEDPVAVEEAESADENPDEAIDEESEAFQSKYKLCQTLGVSEKIKYALSGDKEWRTILIRESNKMVSSAVVKNPRITDQEILTLSKSKIQNDEVIRLICMNKEWIKNYQIRKALVENSKTPLPQALRFLTTLSEKDLISLAKSKNVVTVISTQARRLVMSKQKH